MIANFDSFQVEFTSEYDGFIDDLAFHFKGSKVCFFSIEFVNGVRRETNERVNNVCSALLSALNKARIEYFHANLDWNKKVIFGRNFRINFHGLLELQASSGKWIYPNRESIFRTVIEDVQVKISNLKRDRTLVSSGSCRYFPTEEEVQAAMADLGFGGAA